MPQRNSKPSILPERLIARLWRNRDGRRTLKTLDGRRLRVLYPGRPNGGPGPDFKDALVQIGESGPIRGDVEVHKQPSGWQQHGHHRDPRYNDVVLHVVFRSGGDAGTYRQDGQAVPVAQLRFGDQRETLSTGAALPFAGLRKLQEWRSLSWEQQERLLERAGVERFLEKSAAYRDALAATDADEVLYRGIMEALGYSRNREPFLELARLVPWRTIRETVRSIPLESSGATIRTMLLKAAGLPEISRTSQARDMLAAGSGRSRNTTPVASPKWCFAGVRPQNHPRVRIAGAAELLAGYVETGLMAALVPLVRKRSVAGLRSALTAEIRGVTHIGRDRASDIMVNVLLPVLHALGVSKGDSDLADACVHTYEKTPRLAENEIVREMAFLLGYPPGHPGRGAIHQQGLMHLYYTLLKEDTSMVYPGAVAGVRAVRERVQWYGVPAPRQGWVRRLHATATVTSQLRIKEVA